jgi:uncharacterized membrane protein YeaQ/YmgE (transglycosylase-associated protein family)
MDRRPYLRSPAVCFGGGWPEPRGLVRWQQHAVRAAKESQMNFILWLIVGGVVGWLASLIMKTDAQQGILLNVIVGIVGAFIGGWLISPLLGTGTINEGFSIGSVVVSLIGAVILLAIVNLFRRGRVR